MIENRVKIVWMFTVLVCLGIGVLIGWSVADKNLKGRNFCLDEKNQKLLIKRNGNLWVIFTHGSNMETLGLVHHGEIVASISTNPPVPGVQHAVITTESKTGIKKTYEILNPDTVASDDTIEVMGEEQENKSPKH